MIKKSFIKERILQHIDFQGISQYEFYKITGITRGILGNKNGLSEENIIKYITHYPEINLEWLLTGRGKMLKSKDKEITSDKVFVPSYEVDCDCKIKLLKERLLEINHIIALLTERIKELENKQNPSS